MKKYYYCSVLPKGMKNTYYYIADEEVKVNAFVEFPFGYENTLVIGTVMEVGYFDEDNVPFPVERTKQILRTVSQEEFDNYPGFYAALHDDDDDDIEYELEEAEDYILCEDYDSIFDWAYEHHDRIESDRIMEMVCRCYEICVENGNPIAALNLGTLYYTGTYLERDYQKAERHSPEAPLNVELRHRCRNERHSDNELAERLDLKLFDHNVKKRVYRAREILVKLPFADDVVTYRPEVVKQQVVESLRNERKAVDEHNLGGTPAHKGGYLTENNPNEQQV